MDPKNIQRILATALLLIGLFLLIDQISVLLNIDISAMVRALIILAAVISILAAVILFLDSRHES